MEIYDTAILIYYQHIIIISHFLLFLFIFTSFVTIMINRDTDPLFRTHEPYTEVSWVRQPHVLSLLSWTGRWLSSADDILLTTSIFLVLLLS